jgi:SAM-dependent MidA family methyltransferase
LLVALELLDVVPCPVLEADGDGVLREVHVDPLSGKEHLQGPASAADLAWCRRWWPVPDRPGARVEVGRTRDDVWSDLVSRIDGGVALAVDYAHTAPDRPLFGSLTGFRDGRAVEPVPDGGCDLTAHVALDSVAAAGMDGLPEPQLCTQRESLHRLGLSGRRPPLELAGSDPPGYLRALSAAGEAAELLDPGGLGGFTWLVQPVPA